MIQQKRVTNKSNFRSLKSSRSESYKEGEMIMKTKHDYGLDASFLEETGGCRSPIIAKRINRNCAIIAFDKKLFHTEVIEEAIKEVNRTAETVWQASKHKDNTNFLNYESYMIKLQANFGKQAIDMLTDIANKVSKEVYLRETSRNMPALIFTESYSNSVSIPAISIEAKTALVAIGIKEGQKLKQLTREELCQAPGITTEDVFNLEKNLAVRGIFLKTRIDAS